MTPEKIARFFDSLISLTKSGRLTWERCSPIEVLAFPDTDTSRSFYARFNDGLFFILSKPKYNSISFKLRATEDAVFTQIGEENDSAILRLYNIIYSQFPSTESLIDSIIDEASDE